MPRGSASRIPDRSIRRGDLKGGASLRSIPRQSLGTSGTTTSAAIRPASKSPSLRGRRSTSTGPFPRQAPTGSRTSRSSPERRRWERSRHRMDCGTGCSSPNCTSRSNNRWPRPASRDLSGSRTNASFRASFPSESRPRQKRIRQSLLLRIGNEVANMVAGSRAPGGISLGRLQIHQSLVGDDNFRLPQRQRGPVISPPDFHCPGK